MDHAHKGGRAAQVEAPIAVDYNLLVMAVAAPTALLTTCGIALFFCCFRW